VADDRLPQGNKWAGRGGENRCFRTLLSSATLSNPEEFTRQLLGHENAKIVELKQATEYISRPLDEKYKRSEEEPWDSEGNIETIFSSFCREMDESADQRQQRLVLVLDGDIKVDVLPKLLAPDVIHRESDGVRRCLIFVDSKDMANVLIRNLRKVQCDWRRKDKHFTLTPYHGDCARHHRRLSEGKFREWVPANSLHVIVATSALEAGVNISGCDLVIVLDARRCSCSSLTQRIGRGGRHVGRPALVVIGVSQGLDYDAADSAEDGAEDDSEDDSASKGGRDDAGLLLFDPEKYLADAQSEIKLAICEAMRMYGELQLIRGKKVIGRSTSSLNEEEQLRGKIRDEIPVLSESCDVALSMRGISSSRRWPLARHPHRGSAVTQSDSSFGNRLCTARSLIYLSSQSWHVSE